MFFAHTLKDRAPENWELLIRHLVGTAGRARDFADAFGCAELGYAAGLLHDLGKYQEDFQRRLRGDLRSVDHAAHGAVYARRHYQQLGDLIAHGIAGHHAGLADTLFEIDGRLDRKGATLDARRRRALGSLAAIQFRNGMAHL